ncbi:MAG: molybdopterin-binding protein [Bradyrhizobium sp.]|nr:molybdopterin-binding protein [Bradyrhizobium sp.]
MKFGRIAVKDAMGAIVAHSVRDRGLSLDKGTILDEGDVEALTGAGITSVVAATPEVGDVLEDNAAIRLAERLNGLNVRLKRPFKGRCNLFAVSSGVVRIDDDVINAINRVDEAITVATLQSFRPVVAGEMVATVKIVPMAVPGKVLDRACRVASRVAVSVAPYRPKTIGVISSVLPSSKPAMISKTLSVLRDRLSVADARIIRDMRVAHDVSSVAQAIRTMSDVDIVVIFGASATSDRRDVVPAAIEAAGGSVEHLGMPVDPGNLLLLGHLCSAIGGVVRVVGAPGCARSAKENGFDLVLRRLLTGLPVTSETLCGMGVGGLLSEIALRPQPRADSATNPLQTKAAQNSFGEGAKELGSQSRLGGLGDMSLT